MTRQIGPYRYQENAAAGMEKDSVEFLAASLLAQSGQNPGYPFELQEFNIHSLVVHIKANGKDFFIRAHPASEDEEFKVL